MFAAWNVRRPPPPPPCPPLLFPGTAEKTHNLLSVNNETEKRTELHNSWQVAGLCAGAWPVCRGSEVAQPAVHLPGHRRRLA